MNSTPSEDEPRFRFPRVTVSEDVKFGINIAIKLLLSSHVTLTTRLSKGSVGIKSFSIVHSQDRTSADLALSEVAAEVRTPLITSPRTRSRNSRE